MHFINGMVFVPLADVPNPAGLVPALAQLLDVTTGQNDPAQSLTHYLRNKEMLLVLDNFEHLAAAGSFLTKILAEAPHIKMLVTCREPLYLAAEWRLNLEGMPVPPDEADPTRIEAVQLFLQTARQVSPGYTPTPTELTYILTLCRAVGGMPLALKLAAARVRGVPVKELAAEVQHNLDSLATHMRDLPPRQRSVRAIFDYTWQLMDEEERKINTAMSVFRGGFTRQAARDVANADDLAIAGLVECGVVLVDRAAEESRYTLHRLAQQFGAEKLEARGQIGEMAGRHAEYFAELVGAQLPALASSQHRDAIHLLRREWDNVRRAWDTAIEQERFDLLEKMVVSIGIFTESGAFLHEGIQLYRRATDLLELSQNKQTHPRLLGMVWGWLGRLHYNISPESEGEQYYHQQLVLALETSDPLNKATALLGLAGFATDHNRWGEVITNSQAALEIFTELNHHRGRMEAMTMLGVSNAAHYTPDEAEKCYLQAVDIGRKTGNVRAYLHPLVNLGYLATDTGQYAKAKAYFQEADVLFEQTGTKKTGRLLYLRGRLAAFMGEYEDALHYFEQSRAVRVLEGSAFAVARTDRWLGRIHQLLGDVDTARQIIQRSLKVGMETEHPSSIEIALSHLGLTEEAAGNFALARKHFSEALDLSRELNRRGDVIFNIANLTRVLIQLGELDAIPAGLREGFAALNPATDPRGRSTYSRPMRHTALQLVKKNFPFRYWSLSCIIPSRRQKQSIE
ncbi:MAG: tetratricopeptide repeat protein [Anaerolineae bacterium]|nr:tetratricopeptide repeat protein [Anaerolineae bacterium]